MTTGKDEFRNRIERIRANAPQNKIEPMLAPERMADLTTLRRNSQTRTIEESVTGFWSVPAFRYGLPAVLAVFGFSAISEDLPSFTNVLIRAEAQPHSATDKTITAFNSESITLQPQVALPESLGARDVSGSAPNLASIQRQ